MLNQFKELYHNCKEIPYRANSDRPTASALVKLRKIYNQQLTKTRTPTITLIKITYYELISLHSID
jgi:hypothetical protein